MRVFSLRSTEKRRGGWPLRAPPGRDGRGSPDHRRAASALDEALADAPHGKVLHFGWPDRVIPHGCVGELKREFGLTAEAVAEKLGSL